MPAKARGGDANELRGEILRQLKHNPLWRMFSAAHRWVCPYCGEEGPDFRSQAALLQGVMKHVIECRRDGIDLPPTIVRAKPRKPITKDALRTKATGDERWRITDAKKRWYCPFCAMPTTPKSTQIKGSHVSWEEVCAHLEMCFEFRFRGPRALDTIKISRDLCTQKQWNRFDGNRWICRDCNRTTTARLGPDNVFTPALLRDVEAHLGGCSGTTAAKPRVPEKEMARAQTVQETVQPAAPKVPGLEIEIFHRPCESVGGDFYDLVPFPDGRVGVAIGAVSGEGMQAAVVRSMTKKILNLYAKGGLPPESVLIQTSAEIREELPPNSFATAIYGILDAKAGRFDFCRAGHSPAIRLTDKPALFQPEGPPLGLMDTDRFAKMLKSEAVKLKKGNHLILVTDGLAKALDPHHGLDGVLDVLDHAIGKTAATARRQMESAIGKTHLLDDATMLVFRIA